MTKRKRIDPDHNQDRKFVPCPSTEGWDIRDLILECECCKGYYMYCCSHPEKVCHHYPMFFLDGACAQNGHSGATSGVGIVVGKGAGDMTGIPITDEEDDFPLRSNQRAELLAARLALESIVGPRLFLMERGEEAQGLTKHSQPEDTKELVIATDSTYLVKGITEWLPGWKKNGYKTSKGTKPSNLDLFLKIDEEVTDVEASGYKVGFWYIPREYNGEADRLAKAAAAQGTPALTVASN